MKKINQPLFQSQSGSTYISDLYKETFSIHDGLLQIRLVSMPSDGKLPSISAWTERIGLILEGEAQFKAERTSKSATTGSEAVLAGSEPESEADESDEEIQQIIDAQLIAGDGFYLPPNLKEQEFSVIPVSTVKVLLLEHAFAGIDDHHIPDHFSLTREMHTSDDLKSEGDPEANPMRPLKRLHQGQLDNLHVYGLTLKPGERFEINSHTGKLMLIPIRGSVLTADETSPAIELLTLTPAWKSDLKPMLIYAGESGAHLAIVGLGEVCEISANAF